VAEANAKPIKEKEKEKKMMMMMMRKGFLRGFVISVLGKRRGRDGMLGMRELGSGL